MPNDILTLPDAEDWLNANSRYFSFKELNCSCGCNNFRISKQFVINLNKLRSFQGSLLLTSGYRCPAYNQLVGGVSGSYHTKGMAADISTRNMTDQELEVFIESAKKLFNCVIVYKTFIHVDARPAPYFEDKR